MADVTKTQILTITLCCAACTDDPDCLFELGPYCIGEGETGDGEPLEYYYDQDGVALLLDPDGDRAQALINSGRFVPHGIAPCEEISYTWTEFSEFANSEIRVACCADRGCDWVGNGSELTATCYPEPGPDSEAWSLDGLIGAVAPMDGPGLPRCDEVTPLGWIYEYLYPVSCPQGVVCNEHLTECGCRCDDSSTCGDLDNYLETYFFGPDALADAGWESSCTGLPYRWDHAAYGGGGWVGGSCEFNQPGPGDLSTPPTVQAIMDEASFDPARQRLHVTSKAVWMLLGNPAAFDGTSIELLSDAVRLTTCNDMCQHIGGFTGMEITGIGLYDSGIGVQALRSALRELSETHYTEVETRIGTVEIHSEG